MKLSSRKLKIIITKFYDFIQESPGSIEFEPMKKFRVKIL